MKKIAQLKENNSIIIDCNALVGDQQNNAKAHINGRGTPVDEILKTQDRDDDARSAMTYLSETKEHGDDR